MKRRDTEHQHQVAVIEWWAYAHKGFGVPEFSLFAVPNAGAGAQRGQAGKMKAEGVRSGAPDLILAVRRAAHPGMVIEMKSETGRVSVSQTEFLAWFREQGWRAVVCRSSGEAIDEITSYLRGSA